VDAFVPRLTVHRNGSQLTAITLGHPLLDDYLVFVAARARRNTWLAIAWDLKVFFSVVGKSPAEVAAADVFVFLAAQRAPRRGERVVRLDDGEAGLAARTIARRLSSVRGLYAYLAARGDAGVVGNPVPGSLAARPPSGRRGNGGVPLISTPRTLPRLDRFGVPADDSDGPRSDVLLLADEVRDPIAAIGVECFGWMFEHALARVVVAGGDIVGGR
jgi:integrase/recombinase XerD